MRHNPPVRSEHPTCFDQLRKLVGRWTGGGSGGFPTVPDFTFVEETTFSLRHPEERVLHYEQRVWVVHADQSLEPSHWESGFLTVDDADTIELLNAQNSGRVEVLRGDLRTSATGFVLELASVLHGHDERMVATERSLRYGGEQLEYEVRMATSDIAWMTAHLTARLTRAPHDG